MFNSSILLEKIFNNAHTAMAILDRNFNFIKVNELYAKVDNRSVDDFPGYNHFTYYPNDDAKAIFEQVVQTKQTYQIFNSPFIYFHNPERGLSYWNWTLEPIINDQNEVELLILTLADSTEKRRKELQLEQLFELSHDLLCIVDYNFVIKHINQAFKTTLGYEKNEVIGTKILRYMHSEDLKSLQKDSVQLLQNTPNIKFVIRCCNKKGLYKWIEWTNVLIPDQEVLYYVGRDITIRKQMEGRIEKSNKRINRILESISDSFYTLDNDWNFTYLNKVAREDYPEVAVGQNIWEVFPKLVGTKYYEQYHQAKSTGKPGRFESFAPYAEKWLKVSMYPSQDGLAVYLMDITDRKRAEEKKELEHQRLILLINGMPQLVYILAPDYSIRLANSKFKEVFGNTENRPCYEIFFAREEPCEECPTTKVFNNQVSNYWEATFSNGMNYGIYENPFFDLDGTPLVVKIAVDVTERKNTQQEIARLDRLNMIGKMAAGIGHEVRNPMTTVRGFLQMLSRKPKFAEEKDYFDLMISELDRANSIITDFLSLAKCKPCELAKHNLNCIINELFPLLQADALNMDKNILVELDSVPDNFLNKKEIRQLILNLIRNGLEATSPGGSILIKTYTLEQKIVLAISDEGHGIDASILNNLGTPFLTTKENGTGLGLATCYSIAERNNAKIDVDTSSAGTTFYVKFKLTNSSYFTVP